MTYQFNKIDLPQSIKIPGELHVGKQIILRGRVADNAARFSINFMDNKKDDGDNAFHFNPRMEDEVVVRNSYEDGWQEEERDQPNFPFGVGTDFQIRILVTDDEYKVYVNGEHYIDYSHRLSYKEVDYLKLSEGVTYYDVTFQDRLVAPYKGHIPYHFGAGKAVRVTGNVNPGADRFSINFVCSDDQVGFHFNPRMDEECVVCNAKFDGDWGDEERDHPGFPFKENEYFDLLFIGTESGINVYSNGNCYTHFAQRCPLDDMKYLKIAGDVTIGEVIYFDRLEDDYMKLIPFGLENKDIILIRGFFQQGADVFTVNFKEGDTMDADTSFHISTRRDQDVIVLNNKQDGEWQEEERHELPNQFKDCLPFEIKVCVQRKKFKIYINGKSYAKFAARKSIEDVKAINVGGDAYLYQVKLVRRVEKPYVERIPGTLEAGRWIAVSGLVKKECDHFIVNLQCGRSDDDDIAFHMSARLPEDVIVRNSRGGGDWENEERDQACFPFEPKDLFEILVSVQSDYFRVYINGCHYCDYAHRKSIEDVCHLRLEGDANFFEPAFY